MRYSVKIIVTGGLYPNNWKSIQEKNEENFIRFSEGEILELDWDSGVVTQKIRYTSPEEYLNPSMMFKGAQIYGNKLNVVSNTELVTYDIENWNVERVFSDSTFNDLHGVMEEDGLFWVVNTGLEIIQQLDVSGSVLNEWNFSGVNTWERFDQTKDYRKIGSTKPHDMHINHIFKAGGDYFVTRMLQKDAVGLDDQSKRFNIEVGNPHDGVVSNGRVYFTTTNGHMVVFDEISRELIYKVNLNDILAESEFQSGGWCRGVVPISKDRVIVGFTQLRHTKFKEFVSWAKKLGNNDAPTRLLEFDLSKQKAVKEVVYPSDSGIAIFSVLRK